MRYFRLQAAMSVTCAEKMRAGLGVRVSSGDSTAYVFLRCFVFPSLEEYSSVFSAQFQRYSFRR